MRVTVRLFAALRAGRFAEEERSYPPGIKLQGVMNDLGITATDAPLIFVNGRHPEGDLALRENDIIAFFPPIGGG